MFRSIRLWGVISVIAAMSLLAVPAALAGAPDGTGPDSAMAPANGAVQLAPGQQTWYEFTSSAAPSDANDTQIMVDLAANPQGSVSFSVWTAPTARAMLAGDTSAKAVGSGTVNTRTDSSGNVTNLFNGDLVWVGNSRDATDYFVVVQSNATTPSSYTLSISGNYISFPAAAHGSGSASANGNAATSSELPAPAVLPATGQSNASGRATGNGPFNAFTVNGATTRQLAAGGTDWYAFPYASYDAAGNHTLVSLLLTANPAGSVTFNVWDANGINGWASGDPNAKPVGAGTLHPVTDGASTYDRFGGSLQWSGALVDGGTYYIQVQQTGSTPASYTLQMSQQ